MKRTIDVVITMGGLGSRFRKAGYDVPKYMIEVNGKTLFELSIISLDGYKEEINQYIFIAMNDPKTNVAIFIENTCKQLDITNYQIILLDYLTDGQATTALLAEKYWDATHQLLIYNIDTYVEAGKLKASDLRGDGFIPCFQAEGDHWSFVRLNDSGEVVEIKEKQRISNNCTLGAYYFKSCGLYKDLYEAYYEKNKNLVKGEKYVAPLYNYLLKKRGKIYICNIPTDKVHVLGTPQELEKYRKDTLK